MTTALGPGSHAVAPGLCATVVTHLEMVAPAPARPVDLPDGVTLRPVPRPDVNWYRDIFLRVGGQGWLWTSRLLLDPAELGAILSDADTSVFTLQQDGRDMALLELDFRTAHACELAFFGVAAPLVGTTAARYLMNLAIAEAWARPITRFHVHTCTLDHPRALDFYRRSGFKAVRQEIELFQDPRLSGVLPADAGPHVPVFTPDP